MDLAKALLAHGADPNARIVKALPRQGAFDNSFLSLVGATPFLIAAKAADVTLMRLLVAGGADPLLTTNEQTTPLMVAAGMGYVQGQGLGSENDRLEAVKLALGLGATVDAVNNSGETALHGAATSGANAVVQFLVENGAKLDAKSKDGWTPLAIADGTRSNFRAQPRTAALLRQLMAGDGHK